MTQHSNVWGPCVWPTQPSKKSKSVLAQPWHNLPAAIGLADPAQTMWGLAVGYAVTMAEEVHEVPAWRSAAYAAWQDGACGDDFHQVAKKKRGGIIAPTADFAEMVQSLAHAVVPFGGGQVLSESLMLLLSGHPELERYLGLSPSLRTAEGAFTQTKALLNRWAAAWQAPCHPSDSLPEGLIGQLVALTPVDIAELHPDFQQHLVEVHHAHFLRSFLAAEQHVFDEPLRHKTEEALKVLQTATARGFYNSLGHQKACDPLGLNQEGVLALAAHEGVYLPLLPIFWAGQPITPEQQSVLIATRQGSGLEAGLKEIFASPTFKELPSVQGGLRTARLNRRALLQQFISSIQSNY